MGNKTLLSLLSDISSFMYRMAHPTSQNTRSRGSRLPQVKAKIKSKAIKGGAPKKVKLAVITANIIQKEIIGMGWPVGESLGVEPQLIERYGVSRATLREAIRQLERHGVARMRRGNHGGLIIEQPARNSAVVALSTYMELSNTNFDQLFEARQVIEGMAIEQAARRLSDKDIDTLNALIEELHNPASKQFDTEIALHGNIRGILRDITGNPATSILLDSLYYITTTDGAPKHASQADIKEALSNARNYRLRTLEALIGGDIDQAKQWQRELLQVGQWLITKQLQDGKGNSKPTVSLTSTEHGPAYDAFNKMAQRTALTIARAIQEEKMEPGTRLGTESEIRDKFSVSRAVLREALRILELHTIVKGKRGNGGGFRVAPPSPEYTANIVVSFLQHDGFSPHYFYEIWASIQLASSALAAERIDADGKIRLQSLLATEHDASTPEELLAAIRETDLAIGETGKNVPLALFAQVLGQLAVSYPVSKLTKNLATTLRTTHSLYVQAIIDGKAGIARRHMAKFLGEIRKIFGAGQKV
jgi:DNA-binding FadR family transcriptional regulator